MNDHEFDHKLFMHNAQFTDRTPSRGYTLQITGYKGTRMAAKKLLLSGMYTLIITNTR